MGNYISIGADLVLNATNQTPIEKSHREKSLYFKEEHFRPGGHFKHHLHSQTSPVRLHFHLSHLLFPHIISTVQHLTPWSSGIVAAVVSAVPAQQLIEQVVSANQKSTGIVVLPSVLDLLGGGKQEQKESMAQVSSQGAIKTERGCCFSCKSSILHPPAQDPHKTHTDQQAGENQNCCYHLS